MNINEPKNKIIFINKDLIDEFKYYVKSLEINNPEEINYDYELKSQFVANAIWPNSAINKEHDENIEKWLFKKEPYFDWIYFDDSNDKNNIYVVVYVNEMEILDKNFFEPYLYRYFNSFLFIYHYKKSISIGELIIMIFLLLIILSSHLSYSIFIKNLSSYKNIY